MELKSVEKTEKNNVTLEIAVDSQTFQNAVEKAYKKNVGKISVPGFRKGKAPRKMIEKIYGTGVFYEDAINIVYPEAYDAAVIEAGVEPVDQPSLDVVDVGENGLVFKATVTVKPDVEIKNYKGITAEKIKYTVSEEEINNEIERMRRQSAQLMTADRPAQLEDTAVIDYEGFCDGVAFDGGKAENHSLKLGSGSFIPGFEEQLVGKSAGEQFDIKVNFPTEYHSADLAGKEATFAINLKEVKETQLSELDDEFAKDVSEFETLEELKADIQKKLEDSKEKTSQNQYEEQLLSKMLEGLVADIPDIMIENEIDEIARDFDYRLSMQGMNLVKYLEYTGMNKDMFRESFKEQALRRVQTRLALEKIAALENIQISDEDVEAEYEHLAKTYGVEVDQVKLYVSPKNVKRDLAVVKAVEIVKENAKMTEVDYVEPKVEPDKKEEKAKANRKTAGEKQEDGESKPKARKTRTKKTDGESKE
jgi:trigger factor